MESPGLSLQYVKTSLNNIPRQSNASTYKVFCTVFEQFSPSQLPLWAVSILKYLSNNIPTYQHNVPLRWKNQGCPLLFWPHAMQSHDVSLPQGLCKSTAQRSQLTTSTIIHMHVKQDNTYCSCWLYNLARLCQSGTLSTVNRLSATSLLRLTPVVWPWHKARTASPSGLRQNLYCGALVGFRHNWTFLHLIFSTFF